MRLFLRCDLTVIYSTLIFLKIKFRLHDRFFYWAYVCPRYKAIPDAARFAKLKGS
jgi:hypothetical protein